jgi:hypothetical protein
MPIVRRRAVLSMRPVCQGAEGVGLGHIIAAGTLFVHRIRGGVRATRDDVV